MNNKTAFKPKARIALALVTLVIGFGLIACSNAAPTEEFFQVEVIWNEGAAAVSKSAAFDNGSVIAVKVLVYNSLGERIGSGALTKGATNWGGSLMVTETGSTVFETNALDSAGSLLYTGRIKQTLTGTNDIVTIPVGLAGLLGGSIQGYAPSLDAVVNTFAGSATAGTGVVSPLIGTAAFFINPYGMTSDGTNLYVADMGSNNIRKLVLATQSVSTFAGNISGAGGRTEAVGTAAVFTTPRGITTDGTNLYVADYGNNTIRKIVIDGAAVSAFAGTDGAIAGYMDGTGNLATFHSPSSITYHNGFLYVSDTANNRIRRIEVSTKVVTTLSGLANVPGATNAGFADGVAGDAKFNLPQGITTDGTYVYVADTANHRIRRILISNGTTDTIAGTGIAGSNDGGGNVATFNLPTGIATDGTYLYIAEFGSHVIRKITVGETAALSTVELLAGSAGIAGTIGGTGTAARFNGPSGITTDGTNLYVSDYSGYTIRKIQ